MGIRLWEGCGYARHPRAGLHSDASISSPSWFLSVGAEFAAQHSTILATLVAFCREVMHGDHEISCDQLKFESASPIQPARGLDATTPSETVSTSMLWHSSLSSKFKML